MMTLRSAFVHDQANEWPVFYDYIIQMEVSDYTRKMTKLSLILLLLYKYLTGKTYKLIVIFILQKKMLKE